METSGDIVRLVPLSPLDSQSEDHSARPNADSNALLGHLPAQPEISEPDTSEILHDGPSRKKVRFSQSSAERYELTSDHAGTKSGTCIHGLTLMIVLMNVIAAA